MSIYIEYNNTRSLRCFFFISLPEILPIVLVEFLVKDETKNCVRCYPEPRGKDALVQSGDALRLEDLGESIEEPTVQ